MSDGPDWTPTPNGGFIYLYSSKQEPHIYDRYFCIADKPRCEQTSTHVMPFSLIHKRNQSESVSIKQTISITSSCATADINDKFLCSICLQRTVRCIFIPCKHMCTCSECAEEIRQRLNSVCPICRQIFHEIWDVFL
jgi:E3 ubiquitin-protein ligase XIAP/baculoviral IAP repeat-containing protein 2/3